MSPVLPVNPAELTGKQLDGARSGLDLPGGLMPRAMAVGILIAGRKAVVVMDPWNKLNLNLWHPGALVKFSRKSRARSTGS